MSPDKEINFSPVYYKVIFKKLMLPDDTMSLLTKTLLLRKDAGGISILEEVALLFHFQQ